MRLYQTLHHTIKWKKLLCWYLIITCVMILGANSIFLVWLDIFYTTSVTIMLSLMVIGKVIYGKNEYWPILWPFRIIYEQSIYYDSIEGRQCRNWCKRNLNGEWIHCQHGYFVFKRMDDAMAFKLKWEE